MWKDDVFVHHGFTVGGLSQVAEVLFCMLVSPSTTQLVSCGECIVGELFHLEFFGRNFFRLVRSIDTNKSLMAKVLI